MRVKFRVNLGSIDAAKHELDHSACREGAECDVSDSAAKWLADRGIATLMGVAKSPAIKAVPPKVEHKEKTSSKSEDRE